MREGTFSLDFGGALSRAGEGWGRLSVREIGSDMDIASVRVYWDETPPRASFLSPRFNAELSSADGWDVIAQTLDENISVLKVK